MKATKVLALAALGLGLAAVQPALAGDVKAIVGRPAIVEQASTSSPDVPTGPTDSFVGSSGKMLKLSDFRGKVVLLSFWASYCAPCKHELGSLDRLQAMLGGADFVVIPVSVAGGESSISSTYADYGVSHLGIYRELSEDFARGMGVSGIPTNIVIGRDGHVVHFSLGSSDWDSEQSIAMIKSYIAAPAPAVQQADLVTAAANSSDTAPTPPLP